MIEKQKERKRGRTIALVLAALALVVAIAGCEMRPNQSTPTSEARKEALKKEFAKVDASKLEEGVFKTEYRSLDFDTEEHSVNSWYGFGSYPEPKDDFTKSLGLAEKDALYVQNSRLQDAQWAAVEYDGKKPKALYMDLNANGQLDEGEKMHTTKNRDKSRTYGEDVEHFLTPNFERKIPGAVAATTKYRYLIQARGGANRSATWGVSCVREGWGLLEGKPYRLTLFDIDQNGAFEDFARDYSVLVSPENANPHVGFYNRRTQLSSLIPYNDKYYQMSFSDGIASLRPDTTPLGKLEIQAKVKSGKPAIMNYCRLVGAEDSNVNFQHQKRLDIGIELPAMAYKISSGELRYGKNPNDYQNSWSASFSISDGEAARVVAGQTTVVKMGDPKMTVAAVDYENRYRADKEPTSEFKQGLKILITPCVVGMAGETYSGFSSPRKDDHSSNSQIEPKIEILDSGGVVVASGNIEYG